MRANKMGWWHQHTTGNNITAKRAMRLYGENWAELFALPISKKQASKRGYRHTHNPVWLPIKPKLVLLSFVMSI